MKHFGVCGTIRRSSRRLGPAHGRAPASVRGAHPDQVVHEHRGRPRALARRDDELLRARGRGIPRRIQPRHRRTAGAVGDQVAEAVAVELDAADEVERRMPLRPHEAAVDRDPFAVGEAHGGHGAVVALEVVDGTTLDDDPDVRPKVHIWRSHDVPWLADDPDVRSYDEAPPVR